MNRLCPVKITCPGPSDEPTLNISSEAGDPLIFTGIVWPNPNPPHCLVDCGLNTIQDCFGTTYSYSSQDEADMLARLIAIMCQNDGGNGPITGQQFTNDAQTAFDTCGSVGPGRTSSTVFYTVPAGFVVSPMMDPADGTAWIAASNAAALALAQQRVAGAACCIEPPNSSAMNFIVCVNKEFAFGENLYHLTGPNSAAFYTWTVSAGSLPPGLTLVDEGFDETVQPRQAIAGIEGTPSANGKYTYTIRASRTDLPNCYVEIPDAMEVFGITNADSLATTTCKVDHAFSFQFDHSGGASPPYTYAFDPLQPGPSWMTLSSSGLITGTPDTVTTHIFGVIITDVNGNTCKYDCTLNVTGPKFTNTPPAGTECTLYGFTFTASPATSTFSGTCPPGLSITSNGTVSGYPAASGSQQFILTADDGAGNVNSKTFTINVSDDGSGIAKSVVDIGPWAVTVVNEGGGASHSGGITGGDGVITFNIPAGWPTGTERVDFKASLGHCAAVANYSMQWTLVLEYNQVVGANNTIENVDLALFGSTVHAALNNFAGFSDSGVVTVTPGSANNLVLVCQFNGANPTNAFTGIVRLTLRPLSPP